MPSPEDLAAARQRRSEMVTFIASHGQARGYPPNRSELAAQFGVALGTVDRDLRWLRTNGYLTWAPNRPRTIHLT